jgi:hypothetical protein
LESESFAPGYNTAFGQQTVVFRPFLDLVEPGRHTGIDFAKKTFANFLNIHSTSPVASHPVFKWRAPAIRRDSAV